MDARKSAVCRCNVGFLKISPDKHVDVCVDSDEDRGSTPLASSPESFRGCRAVALAKAGLLVNEYVCPHSKATRGRVRTPKAFAKQISVSMNFAPSAFGVRCVIASLFVTAHQT